MSIKLDGNRKTFRSDVKSRSGKRLPGLEAHYQGVDFTEANINRALLPVMGRDNPGGALSHNYDPVQAVYRSVPQADAIATKRIADFTLVMDPANATWTNGTTHYTTGTSDFSLLAGQTFTIHNPYHQVDNSAPASWTFEFTMTEGIDPRRMLIQNGLYPGSKVAADSLDDVGKHPMNIHANSYVRGSWDNADLWSDVDYMRLYREGSVVYGGVSTTNLSKLQLYGAYNSTSGRYEIPLGLSSDDFNSMRTKIHGSDLAEEGEQYRREEGVSYNTAEGFNIMDPRPVALSIKNRFSSLFGENTAWLYLVITRALYNVLPEYIEILNPIQKELPAGVGLGSSFMFWDKKRLLDPPYTGSQYQRLNPLKIKLYYTEELPAVLTPISNTAPTADIAISSWTLGDPVEYVLEGHRELERDKNTFYEDFRSDWLQTTYFQDFSERTPTGLTNTSGQIKMYSPQVSQGSAFLSAGTPIVAFDNVISGTNPSQSGLEVVSELVTIHKSQKRDAIPNTALDNLTFFEDKHYEGLTATETTQGGNQKLTNWSYMQKYFKQFVNPADHGNSDSAAFVQHIENFIDGNYERDSFFSPYPMSHRIDVLQTNRNFHENTPPSVLERTLGCAAFMNQYIDPDSVTITANKYKKAEETVGIKMFEDVRGQRREPRPEFWDIVVDFGKASSQPFEGDVAQLTRTIRVYQRWWFGDEIGGVTEEMPERYSAKWRDKDYYRWRYIIPEATTQNKVFHGDLTCFSSITHTEQEQDLLTAHDRIAAAGGEPAGIIEHNSVMFLDYFDQEEPDTLDFKEVQYWSRIDSTMLSHLSQQYWNHDNNTLTPEIETFRPERREWQDDQYLYANTGHTSVHSVRVNGIISQEHKR